MTIIIAAGRVSEEDRNADKGIMRLFCSKYCGAVDGGILRASYKTAIVLPPYGSAPYGEKRRRGRTGPRGPRTILLAIAIPDDCHADNPRMQSSRN